MTRAIGIVNKLIEAEEQTEFSFSLPSSQEIQSIIHGAMAAARAAEEEKNGKLVKDYDFRGHGVENCQFWQGVSTSYTRWDEVFTGLGQNAYEAAEEAIGQAAEDGWDIRSIKNEFNPNAGDVVAAEVAAADPEATDEEGDVDTDEVYYYVTLWIEGEPPFDDQPEIPPVEESEHPKVFPIGNPEDTAPDEEATMRQMVDYVAHSILKPGHEAISATSIPSDIIEACLAELMRISPSAHDDFVSEHSEEMEWVKNPSNLEDDTVLQEFMGKVFDKLNRYCPPYTYYGFFEADNSVGCWPNLDRIREEASTPEDPQPGGVGFNAWMPDTEYSYFEQPDGHSRLCRTGTKELIWEW